MKPDESTHTPEPDEEDIEYSPELFAKQIADLQRRVKDLEERRGQ